MLYLAQYLSSGSHAKPWLRLLALQQSPRTWQVLDTQESARLDLEQPLSIAMGQAAEQYLLTDVEGNPQLSSGVLLLVNVEGSRVIHWESASPWILSMVHTYLSGGETPEFLTQEQHRLEAWRQQLTLEQQELGRRLLEVEARLAKIQTIQPETPAES